MNAGKNFERRVLLIDTIDALLERPCISRSPPIAQIALRIELPALIVEAMCELMANHGADAAEVYGIVDGLIEERRLQDSRWEVDVVECGAVVGVHGRWSHSEFAAVERLADLCQFAIHFKS